MVLRDLNRALGRIFFEIEKIGIFEKGFLAYFCLYFLFKITWIDYFHYNDFFLDFSHKEVFVFHKNMKSVAFEVHPVDIIVENKEKICYFS